MSFFPVSFCALLSTKHYDTRWQHLFDNGILDRNCTPYKTWNLRICHNMMCAVGKHTHQRKLQYLTTFSTQRSRLDRKVTVEIFWRNQFLPVISGDAKLVSVNRRRYVDNIFSHWLRLFAPDENIENSATLLIFLFNYFTTEHTVIPWVLYISSNVFTYPSSSQHAL